MNCSPTSESFKPHKPKGKTDMNTQNTPKTAAVVPETPRYENLTLQNVISQRVCDPKQGWIDWDGKLNGYQQSAIVGLLGSRCRKETVNRLWRAVNDNCRKVKSCGIMDRVMLAPNGASYCAGQSYPDEIRVVRQTVIASY
jgi:hypothetical protein